jgi:hypothetical protein
MTYSRVSKPTLPSALDVFTSEFGMGSGGSRPLLPPGKPLCAPLLSLSQPNAQFGMIRLRRTPKLFECYMVKPHEQLVLVSFIDYSTSTPSLSTS